MPCGQVNTDSAVLIAVLNGSMSDGYTFAVAPYVDTATLPDPLEVAALATEKLLDTGL